MTVTPELEAVAKAIALASLADAGADRERIERLVSKCWDRWLPEARAALMAIRLTLSDETVRAGLVANTCALPTGGELAMAVEPAWEAMIDHILGEPAQP